MTTATCPDPDHHAYLEQTTARYGGRVKCPACRQRVGGPLTGGEKVGLGVGYGFVALYTAGALVFFVVAIILAIKVSAAFGALAALIVFLLLLKLLPSR